MEKEKNLLETQENEAIAFANQPLPDLSKAEVVPIEVLGEYWSPSDGDVKRVFFVGFDTQSVIEPATGETRDLNIVKFLERQPNGDIRTIRNGSARLYGAFEQMARDLTPGRPFEIKYCGKTKTNTGKFADSWSVKPLIVK